MWQPLPRLIISSRWPTGPLLDFRLSTTTTIEHIVFITSSPHRRLTVYTTLPTYPSCAWIDLDCVTEINPSFEGTFKRSSQDRPCRGNVTLAQLSSSKTLAYSSSHSRTLSNLLLSLCSHSSRVQQEHTQRHKPHQHHSAYLPTL